MKLFLFFFCLFFAGHEVAAQFTVIGKIVDQSTNHPVSYVNIGVIGTSVGTVSREDGYFELSVYEIHFDKNVRFSIIGYKPNTYSLAEFVEREDHLTIKMEKETYELEEVSVNASRLKEKRLGSRASSDRIITGWSQNIDGGERGIRIKTGGKPIYLKNLHFHIANNNFEKVLFRVHIRSIEDDKPGQSLLREDIIVSVTESMGWVEVDLEPYSLVFDEDIAVTLQPVSTQGSCMAQCLHISAGIFRYFSSNWLLAKDGSEGEWIVKKNWSPGIYLTVYQ